MYGHHCHQSCSCNFRLSVYKKQLYQCTSTIYLAARQQPATPQPTNKGSKGFSLGVVINLFCSFLFYYLVLNSQDYTVKAVAATLSLFPTQVVKLLENRFTVPTAFLAEQHNRNIVQSKRIVNILSFLVTNIRIR